MAHQSILQTLCNILRIAVRLTQLAATPEASRLFAFLTNADARELSDFLLAALPPAPQEPLALPEAESPIRPNAAEPPKKNAQPPSETPGSGDAA
jgi:hypothetical protein